MLALSRDGIRNARRILTNRQSLHGVLPSTSQSVTSRRFYPIIKRTAAVPILSDQDAKLINIGHFVGIKGTVKRPEKVSSPEVELSTIEQHLRQNFRVSGEAVFCNILKPLEDGNEQLLFTLRNNHERWLPTLFLACGRAMSNVHKDNRQLILNRIIGQLQINEISWSVLAFNVYLRVLMENDVEFDVNKQLHDAEVTKGLSLDQESFRLFLEQLALQGKVDASRNLTYEMAKRGLILDAQCNSAIIYGFAVHGYEKKADSLYQQTKDRHGSEGQILALEALAKAAAARNDLDQLRKILRIAVDDEKKLTLSNGSVFDILWLLTEKSRTKDGLETMPLIEQILSRVSHQWGFFKLLIREIERHLAHGHYYIALTLLEDSTKVKDFIHKQQKLVLVDQIQTRLCRQLIKNHSPIPKVKEVANRAMVVLKSYPSISKFIYDELLKNVLTFKEFSLETRFEYFSSLIDFVDLERTRPHLILPLLASCDDLSARLTLLFRCERLGYKDFSKLDTKCLVKLLLQPLYDKQNRKTTDREPWVFRFSSMSIESKSNRDYIEDEKGPRVEELSR
ncbi:unnamed protein product, partial [Mesorhabditis belari]|uniref:Uncharacterized protein n=1 Tax=Mesorhabditis belari TaxID=2138241 RepID=A0AAF3F796_9BILA